MDIARCFLLMFLDHDVKKDVYVFLRYDYDVFSRRFYRDDMKNRR